LSSADRVRVSVQPIDHRDVWNVEIAARPDTGVLRAAATALAARRHDVERASIAVWGDGAIAVSLTVGGPERPDADVLRDDIVAALASPQDVSGNRSVELTFDNDGSPLATLCEVTGSDRFELTEANGEKLSLAKQTAIRQTVFAGGKPARRRVVPFGKR
jgi:hypothetical protein